MLFINCELHILVIIQIVYHQPITENLKEKNDSIVKSDLSRIELSRVKKAYVTKDRTTCKLLQITCTLIVLTELTLILNVQHWHLVCAIN